MMFRTLERCVGIAILAIGVSGPYLSQLNRITAQYPASLHLGPWSVLVRPLKGDITEPLQQCANVPNPMGVRCYLPPGTFTISRSITIHSNTSIVGGPTRFRGRGPMFTLGTP